MIYKVQVWFALLFATLNVTFDTDGRYFVLWIVVAAIFAFWAGVERLTERKDGDQ